MSYPPSQGSSSGAPGYPDQQGYPQQGYPQQGYPQQGNPQQGYPQQAYPQQPPSYPQGGGAYSGHAQVPPAQPTYGDQYGGDPSPFGSTPPEPVKKKRTGLKVTLIILAVLVVLCGGGAIAGYVVIGKSYPAKVATPDSLVGLTRSTAADDQAAVDGITTELKKQAGASDAVAAVYNKDGDATHPILVIAVSGLFFTPDSQVTEAFKGLSDGTSAPTPQTVPSGSLGGTTKCAKTDVGTGADALPTVFCVWADYGSIGLIGFVNSDDINASAAQFLQLRAGVETH